MLDCRETAKEIADLAFADDGTGTDCCSSPRWHVCGMADAVSLVARYSSQGGESRLTPAAVMGARRFITNERDFPTTSRK
jgi:hypothetical protein